jgi:hypothetical protein
MADVITCPSGLSGRVRGMFVSAAVAVISAAIQIVMSVFSGLADVITGIVFIIGGIFTGSWSDIWMGMKLVAFGVVDAIIGVVLELAGAIAGIDDMASLAGAGRGGPRSRRARERQVLHAHALGHVGAERVAEVPDALLPVGALAEETGERIDHARVL